MSIYLVIVIAGFMFKCDAVARTYENLADQYQGLRVELSIFFLVMCLFSLTQIFIFAPPDFAAKLGINLEYVIRSYYVIDGMSTAAGAYLLMSMFGLRWHRHPLAVIIVLAYTVVGAYQLWFTDTFIIGTQRIGVMTLALPSEASQPLVGARLIALGLFIVVTGSLVVTYRSLQDNQEQIRNFIALIAFAFFDANYILGLFTPTPLMLSVRGILFFFVVVLTLHRSDVFDIRVFTPNTAENESSRKLKRLFTKYANQRIDHISCMNQMKQELIQYKLKKMPPRISDVDTLETLAKSMKMDRKNVLDELQKLKIHPFKRKL